MLNFTFDQEIPGAPIYTLTQYQGVVGILAILDGPYNYWAPVNDDGTITTDSWEDASDDDLDPVAPEQLADAGFSTPHETFVNLFQDAVNALAAFGAASDYNTHYEKLLSEIAAAVNMSVSAFKRDLNNPTRLLRRALAGNHFHLCDKCNALCACIVGGEYFSPKALKVSWHEDWHACPEHAYDMAHTLKDYSIKACPIAEQQ